MTNKEKKEYMSLALAYSSGAPFISELEKRADFYAKRPKRLYKYRSFDEHSIEMLDGCYAYSTPVGRLDDPFDCLTNIDLDRLCDGSNITLSDAIINAIVETVFSHPHSDSIGKEELVALAKKSVANGNCDYQVLCAELEKLDNISDKQKQAFCSVMLNFQSVTNSIVQSESITNLLNLLLKAKDSIGVCSLTTQRDNKVMWSLYGSTYKGYCVEYEEITDPDTLKCLRPVIYTKRFDNDIVGRLVVFSLESIIRMVTNGQMSTNIGALDELMCTKDADWKFQDEWRIVSNPGAHIPLKAKAVYLGFDVQPENEKKMMACAKRNGFALYKMNSPTGSKKVTYTKIV